MCPEFILAFIYLIILLIINYLLFKLLKNYIKNISSLLKLKRIFFCFDKKETKLISMLYQTSKKEIRSEILFFNLKNFSKRKDILIIGNIYKLISNLENLKENGNLFYFQLLERQYLSNQNSLK